MIIGVLKDHLNENRVCLTPDNVTGLLKINGVNVLIEQGAGESSFIKDSYYVDSGAKISSRESIISSSDMVLQVNAPDESTLSSIKGKPVLIGAFNPFHNLGCFCRNTTFQNINT